MPVPQDGTDLLDKVGVCDAERRLLTAIRCVPSCRGLLLALLLLEAALEAYFRLSALPRVGAWLAVVTGLIERVEQLDDEGAVGLRKAGHGAQGSVYGWLCATYPARLKPQCHERALALLGMLVMDACCKDRPLLEAPIAGWYTLIQGGGRTADWKEFATVVPVSLEGLHTALTSSKAPGLSDLLAAVIAALGRAWLDPDRDPLEPNKAKPAPPEEGQSATDEPGSAADGEGNADDLAEGEDDPNADRQDRKKRGPLNTKESRENPVAWLVKAANYAPHIQRFDLVGYIDRLHPLVTRACWKSYRERFNSQDAQEKVWVAFAHVTQRLAQLQGRHGLQDRLHQGKRHPVADAGST